MIPFRQDTTKKKIFFAVREHESCEQIAKELSKIKSEGEKPHSKSRRIIAGVLLGLFCGLGGLSALYIWKNKNSVTETPQERHTHYIFAIDVSVSMRKYGPIVTHGLMSFLDSIPDIGDHVTIIPFAQIAYFKPYLSLPVDSNKYIKFNIRQELYNWFLAHDQRLFDTNILEAQKAVMSLCKISNHYDVTVVFISDLIHCPNNNIDRQFTETEMQDMHHRMSLIKNPDVTYRVFTIELPRMGSENGYVFQQLQELYSDWEVEIEQLKVQDGEEDLILQYLVQLPDY